MRPNPFSLVRVPSIGGLLCALIAGCVLGLAPRARAADPAAAGYALVSRDGAHKERRITIATSNPAPTAQEFARAVLDANAAPLTAEFMGVRSLLDSQGLGTAPDGRTVIYQRTGGGYGLASRHYVIALRVTRSDETGAVIEWDLVQHTKGAGGGFQGPYHAALDAHPEAIYTPYNTGSWRLDRVAHTLTYTVKTDPGGMVPEWLATEKAVSAFPLELLRANGWGG